MVRCAWHRRGGQKGKAGKKKKRLNAHESYQLLVGEMGVPRRDYLYLMPYWEIVLTVRGYYRRNILQYELQRIQAFSAAFAFGGNKNNISPRDFIPLPFDDDEGTDDEDLTDEEINEQRRRIEEENEKNSQ